MLVLFGSSAVLDTTVGHTMDVVSPVSFPGESCQRNVTDLAVGRVAGRRAGYSKGPTTEHGTPVSRYEQLMAAGGPQTHTHTHTHTTITLLRTASTRRAASTFCSVLQPSWIRRLATPWTYFLHLSLSSVILTDSSTGSPVHILMLSIQAARGRICICTAI